jgi:hypothetical protein
LRRLLLRGFRGRLRRRRGDVALCADIAAAADAARLDIRRHEDAAQTDDCCCQ